MAGNFVSASSQYIKNAAPSLVSTGYPLTMAAWVKLNATGISERAVSYNASANTTHFLQIGCLGGGQWVAGGNDGGSTAGPSGGIVDTNWNFLIGRFIASGNIRLDVLQSDGSTVHLQSVTAKTPAGLNTIGVGANVGSTPSNFWDGLIAEVWYTDADIQADGGALSDGLLRQLAYGGPFSVAHIGKDIVEYRSLRKALTSDSDDGTEVYARNGVQTWTQIGSPTVGPHCPVPYWYVKPRQTERILTV